MAGEPGTGALPSAVEVTAFSLVHTTADALRWRPDRAEHGPSCPLGAIGPVQLARLGELLGLGGSERLVGSFSLLAGESQESPWVVSVPEELGLAVAGVDDRSVMELAGRWSSGSSPGGVGSAARSAALLARFAGFLRSTAGPWVLLIRVGRAAST